MEKSSPIHCLLRIRLSDLFYAILKYFIVKIVDAIILVESLKYS